MNGCRPGLGPRPAAVLFDLDGTLLDTAPDMVAALNELRAEQDADALPYEFARNHVSNGAVGLLRIAFEGFDPARQPELHRRYLELYAARLCRETRLFPALEDLLTHFERQGIPWGIVTNKPRYLTEPLLAGLGLADKPACVVSGDTLTERKPHPRPVLFALETLGADPSRSIYVGDAPRDIESGRAAGTTTIAVEYGYIEPGQNPGDWGADHVVGTPPELVALLTETE